MDKNGFLEKLAVSLAGQVPRAVIEENVRYYDDYITGETKKGTPLREVLESLGDPRLIARSIIDANGGGEPTAAGGIETGRRGGPALSEATVSAGSEPCSFYRGS